MKHLLMILPFSFILLCCNQMRQPSQVHFESIKEASSRFWRAFEIGNADSVAAQVTDDFMFMAPGMSDLQGRTTFREAVSQIFTMVRVTGFTVHSRDINVCDSTAYELATYTETIAVKGKEPQTSEGRYLLVWKLQPNGTWLVYKNLYNHVTP